MPVVVLFKLLKRSNGSTDLSRGSLSVNRSQPFARQSLRPDDLGLAHIVRDFRPVALGIIVAADGSDIEPLMRLE